MKTSKIDRIKEAVWNISITYDETAKKLRQEAKNAYEVGEEDWVYKQKEADMFKYMARGASNAYLAVCAAAKGK